MKTLSLPTKLHSDQLLMALENRSEYQARQLSVEKDPIRRGLIEQRWRVIEEMISGLLP